MFLYLLFRKTTERTQGKAPSSAISFFVQALSSGGLGLHLSQSLVRGFLPLRTGSSCPSMDSVLTCEDPFIIGSEQSRNTNCVLLDGGEDAAHDAQTWRLSVGSMRVRVFSLANLIYLISCTYSFFIYLI